MMALRLAMRLTPTARTTVMAAGRPSGMADTAMARVKRNSSINSKPRHIPTTRVKLLAIRARIISFFERSRVRLLRGVFAFSVLLIWWAIFPISLFIPVA